MINEKNQIAIIWLSSITLVVVAGYFVLQNKKKKTIVVEDKIDEELGTTPTPAPAKTNPFTALLGKTFAPIDYKPTDYSVKNPFADVNTAIANVNPFSSSVNTSDRLV